MYPSKKVRTDERGVCLDSVTWVSGLYNLRRVVIIQTCSANTYINCENGILLKGQIVKSKLLRVMYE